MDKIFFLFFFRIFKKVVIAAVTVFRSSGVRQSPVTKLTTRLWNITRSSLIAHRTHHGIFTLHEYEYSILISNNTSNDVTKNVTILMILLKVLFGIFPGQRMDPSWLRHMDASSLYMSLEKEWRRYY